jgi:hypothetical protein
MADKNKLGRLLGLSLAVPVMAFAASLALPDASYAAEGCYFENEFYSHGACSDNDCWFWQGNQRCDNGSWGNCGSC